MRTTQSARRAALAIGIAGASLISFVGGPVFAGHGYMMNEHPAANAKMLKEILASREELSIFTHALKQSPLWNRLSLHAPLTLFVPSDAAMQADGTAFLLEEVLTTESNKQLLWDSMALHMAPRTLLFPEAIEAYAEINTLAALCISMQIIDGKVRVGPDSTLIEHISAEDGSVYVVDRMLWRPWQGGDHCNGPVVSQLPRDLGQQTR